MTVTTCCTIETCRSAEYFDLTGSVTAAVGPRLRLGVEMLQANMFGKYSDFKERATLITPVVEFEFSPGQRFNPYLVVGVGYTQYRALEPNALHFFDSSLPEFEWRKEGSFNLAGGLGVRWFMTKRFFVPQNSVLV